MNVLAYTELYYYNPGSTGDFSSIKSIGELILGCVMYLFRYSSFYPIDTYVFNTEPVIEKS